MRRHDAAEAEDRQVERMTGETGEPSAAAPNGEEAEGNDQAGSDDGRGEEADDEGAAGKAQPVERPGERGPDDERENGRERRLQRGDVDEVADI